MRTTPKHLRRFLATAALLAPLAPARAQSTTGDGTDQEEPAFELNPFEVTATEGVSGYNAETTLAGNRLRTELRDIGSAVSVVTKEFLNDVGATDNSTLLQY